MHRSEFNALVGASNAVFLSSFPPCHIYLLPVSRQGRYSLGKRRTLAPNSPCYVLTERSGRVGEGEFPRNVKLHQESHGS